MTKIIKNIGAMLFALALAGTAFAASTNSSPDLDTFYVTDVRGDSPSWAKSISVSSGEIISFDLHYHLGNGVSTSDMRFAMENLDGRTFNSGATESVWGQIMGTGLSTSSGNVNLSFSDKIRLELYNVSWQIYPCQSVSCGESLPEARSNVLNSGGMSIGAVNGSGDDYSGNVIVAFKAVRVDTSRPSDNGGSNSGIEIETLSASSVDEDSARLRGEVEDGDNLDVWFVMSRSDSTPSCSSSSIDYSVSGSFDDGDTFYKTVSRLREDTTYYYRACGETSDGDTDSGNIRSFRTDDDHNNRDDDYVDDVEVRTLSASSVDGDSARLRGEVEWGEDLDIWFVLSGSDSTPSCTSSSLKHSVSGSFDEDDAFYRNVSGLRKNDTYYYRACGENYYGDTHSGSVRSFRTKDDGKYDEDASVVTSAASGVSENSARLNSVVRGEDSAYCYFEYGTTLGLGFSTSRVRVELDQDNTCSSFITNLYPGTTYYYRALLDQGGKTFWGVVRSFRTSSLRVFTSATPPTTTVIKVVEEKEKEELNVWKWVSGEFDSDFVTEIDAKKGELVFYKVRVRNDTGDEITGVTVTDYIPYYLELAEESEIDDDSKKELVWIIGSLDAGESRTFITELRVREDAPEGEEIYSYATLESKEYNKDSNEVLIVVSSRLRGGQLASIFGAGFWPNSLLGWLLILILLTLLTWMIYKLLFVRTESKKSNEELRSIEEERIKKMLS